MRQVLVDYARKRRAEKRGGGSNRVPLDEALRVPAFERDPEAELALDEAMTALAERFPRQARVVELRSYAGFSVCEAAEALDVSDRTVEEDWAFAKAWLRCRLS
ncbi:MAG: hypothetical protein HS102_16475 [Planctomycetia bacterium]|nr:hypothetical protein [Planctomycetia bacterium]